MKDQLFWEALNVQIVCRSQSQGVAKVSDKCTLVDSFFLVPCPPPGLLPVLGPNTGMENFASQMEKASENPCQIVILGDANLCSQKWNDPGFINKNVEEVLKNMYKGMEQCSYVH